MFLTMRDFANALKRVSAPGFIVGGTVLGLVRHCDPNPRGPSARKDDVDFSLEHSWYIANFKKLADVLVGAGFAPKFYFPGAKLFGKNSLPPVSDIEKVGFETAWTKRGVKVDLFSVVTDPDKIVGALWTGGGSHYNRCTWRSTARVPFNWYGVDVLVPAPLDMYLTSAYGVDYMKPQPWRWDVTPFKLGVCVSGGRRRELHGTYSAELYQAALAWTSERESVRGPFFWV